MVKSALAALVQCAVAYTLFVTLTLADTLYEGGFLRAELIFPPEYPLMPPKMKFITPMWHPNGKCGG